MVIKDECTAPINQLLEIFELLDEVYAVRDASAALAVLVHMGSPRQPFASVMQGGHFQGKFAAGV